MLRIDHRGAPLCDGITRREWLRVGGIGLGGLSLPSLFAQRAMPAGERPERVTGRAKSCIVLFLLGGPPQHETWDPKPEAPREIRGDFLPIASAVPGVLVGELMPRTAKLTKHIAVLRALHTGDGAHSTSGYTMSTGMPHVPVGVESARPGAPNDWPCLGALVRSVRGDRNGLPGAITLPEILANDGNVTWPGQDAGFLGPQADPWTIECDPSQPDFRVAELALPPEVSPARFESRRTLLARIESQLAGLADDPTITRQDVWRRKAFDLLASPETRRAFDLSREPDAVRERYGRNRFGQSVLLARRLVEAGVSLVQVNWTRIAGALNNGHWDTHSKNAEALRATLMPRMDLAYSALLEDLLDRGLLDDTLVVWTGEFGRTPKINSNGGRDHWGNCFSAALAGGGVRGGVLHGTSDDHAAQPVSGRTSAADFLATIFHALGHAPEETVPGPSGRPLHISQGTPVRELF